MFRKFVFSWAFVIAALLSVCGAVIAFITTGDPFNPLVIRFSLLALLCITVQMIYDEVAGRV